MRRVKGYDQHMRSSIEELLSMDEAKPSMIVYPPRTDMQRVFAQHQSLKIYAERRVSGGPDKNVYGNSRF